MSGRRWSAPLLCGAMVIAGCGREDDSAAGTAPSAGTAAVAAAPETGPMGSTPAELAFEDSFDDDRNRWGVVDDPKFGTAVFDGGDYIWQTKGSLVHWLPEVLGEQYDRGELDMLNVVVRAEATIDAGDGVVGVFCRETPDTDAEWQWYEFVVRDGFAAIRHADLEGNIELLTKTDDVSLPVGEPMAIEATCVNDASGVAQLSLALNGREVLQASDDDPLGNGAPGLQIWTFPSHSQMDVRWHEFSIAGAAA